MRSCMRRAAFMASSAVGNVDMTSSPMVLITLPRFASVAMRMISRQRPTISRALMSPRFS